MICFFGNNHDGEFSEKTLKKLTVKQDSFLRKVMPFKEIKGDVRPKYLFIRIIPLLVHILEFLILMPVFVLDQLLINILIDDIFGYIGLVSIAIFVLYKILQLLYYQESSNFN